METQEVSYLTTLATTLAALGIVSSSDRLIGYSLIGAGMLLSIAIMIKAKKEVKGKRPVRRGS